MKKWVLLKKIKTMNDCRLQAFPKWKNEITANAINVERSGRLQRFNNGEKHIMLNSDVFLSSEIKSNM